MKIVLRAFNGKLISEAMDVPEGTGTEFYLPMSMDILTVNPHPKVAALGVLDSNSVMLKRGHFKMDGHKYNLVKDLGIDVKYGDENEAWSYTLIAIS